MPKFKLAEILEATGAALRQEGKQTFSDVVTDTRRISDGVLFVALSGERFNGEDFAAEAVEKGAAGVLVTKSCPAGKLPKRGAVLMVEDTLRAYQQIARAWRMKFDLPVVAVTGSNGKTTTKDLTAAVLSARGPVCKTQGNFNNEIGLPLTLLGLQEEHTAAVVEIGMRGLHQIEALAPLAAPSIGIVTNVGETHMELLGSIENIAQAKGELVEAIPAGGAVVLNLDDPHVAAMRGKAKEGVRVITYGIEQDADVRGEGIRRDGDVTRFMICWQNERHDYVLPMLGRHNIYNALAAIATGFAMGMTAAEVMKGLRELEATKMRFERVAHPKYEIINDAYNASPMSMKAALETLSGMAKGRKIAVLGDMLELGDISEKAHREVGREVAEHDFSALVTYGELGKMIASGAKEAGLSNVHTADSHEQAAEFLKDILQEGDTVLFKGSRGMQMEKIIEMI